MRYRFSEIEATGLAATLGDAIAETGIGLRPSPLAINRIPYLKNAGKRTRPL